MYPVTIQDEDLRLAFLAIDGVQELIGKIVDSVYTAAEYDEFLLFKYLLIKAIAKGQFYPVSIGDGTTLSDAAEKFRGISNLLPFMSSKFNASGVKTTTPKDRQVIFMDAMFNAEYDVNVLASAFNMDKADFMGRLFLIDDWTTFDNERFEVIRENSDGLEEVTAAELALMADVKAVILDENWFQVYDNNNKFTEKYAASGLYWNYFYHTWKTISSSPFANCVVFATSSASISAPDSFRVTISGKDESATAITMNFTIDDSTPGLNPMNVSFTQTEALTASGIAVQKFGGLLIPISEASTDITLKASIGDVTYTAEMPIASNNDVGDSLELVKDT
jgi:hypothetical protein